MNGGVFIEVYYSFFNFVIIYFIDDVSDVVVLYIGIWNIFK